MFYLPTKEECDFIVKNSKQFFCKKIDDIYIYHYKQALFEEFEKFNAYELRGLTFVNNKRFLAIHKFFELDQAIKWRKEDLKDKKIIKVQEKIDGTFVHPVVINDKIFFKTKLGFDTYQAKRAQYLFENNKNLKEFVIKTFKEGKIPLFEYVSPKTQIVMDYKEEKLFLIQIRDLKTGEYDLAFEEKAKKYNLPFPKVFDIKSLDELLKLAKNNKDIEGWVVIFENMHFVKVKTDFYLENHKLVGDLKENTIIQAIFDKNIDKIFNILNENSERYLFVKEVYDKFTTKYTLLENELLKIINNFKGTKKEFKEKFSSHPFYPLLSEAYKKRNKINPKEVIKEWVKNNTKKLKNAKRFLES